MVQNRQHNLPELASKAATNPANSVIAAGGPDDHFISDYERGTGSTVIFVSGRVWDVPYEVAGTQIEAKQVSIVGFYIYVRMPQRDPAIVVR